MKTGGDLNFDLGSQLREYAKVVDRRIDYVHRNLGMLLFTAIVYDTPIDTGLARGSWFPSKGSPKAANSRREDKTGSAVSKDIQAVCMAATVKDVLWMTNGIPYIEMLEYGTASYGFSKQAPDGMVRSNVVKVHRMVRDIVAKAKEIK